MFMLNFNSKDPYRPNFFEMVAQQEFIVRLKPATQYMFSVLSMRNSFWNLPTIFIDELFFVFQYFVEKHYLHYFQSSFSENFYNLRREESAARSDPLFPSPLSPSPSDPLSPRQQRLSLFFLVIFPYLKAKLDNYVQANLQNNSNELEELFEGAVDGGQQLNRGNSNHSVLVKLKRLLLQLYPYLNFIYECVLLCYQILYMHDYTRYFDFFLHYQRIEVKRMSLRQMIMQQKNVEIMRKMELEKYGEGWIAEGRKMMHRLNCQFFDYAPYLLPVLFLAFRFTVWWYSEYGQSSSNKLIPPPPSLPSPPPGGEKLPADRTICPLCKEKRTNPAFLATSGYVFCYPCIYTHVNSQLSCPVSLLPSSIDQIRKIYENT